MPSKIVTRQSSLSGCGDLAEVSNRNSQNPSLVLQHDAKISAKNENTFPWRLHVVLDAAEAEGFTDIVSWVDERSFCVHKIDAFCEHVMPRFFQQTKYKSFQRQCNLWGFDRIPNGLHRGGYVRVEHFVRGQPSLVAQIQRMKIKGSLSKRRCHKDSSLPASKSVRKTSRASGKAKTKKRSMQPVILMSRFGSDGDDEILPPLDNKGRNLSTQASLSEEDDFRSFLAPMATDDGELLDFDYLNDLDFDILCDGAIDTGVDIVDNSPMAMGPPADRRTSNDSIPLLEDNTINDRESPNFYPCLNGSGGHRSSLIGFLIAGRYSHQSSQVSTSSTDVQLPSSSSSSVASSTSSSNTGAVPTLLEPVKPLSAICAFLRNSSRPVSPSSTSRSSQVEQMAIDFMPPIYAHPSPSPPSTG